MIGSGGSGRQALSDLSGWRDQIGFQSRGSLRSIIISLTVCTSQLAATLALNLGDIVKSSQKNVKTRTWFIVNHRMFVFLQIVDLMFK